MPIYYDPAKEACDPNYIPYRDYLNEHLPTIVGPGGTTNRIENNEKGILETSLFGVIALHQEAALGSNHDPERQGIYRSTSMGDND